MHPNNFVNYSTTHSNSTNYLVNETSSCPESWPELLEYGVIVKYEVEEIEEESLDDNIKKE